LFTARNYLIEQLIVRSYSRGVSMTMFSIGGRGRGWTVEGSGLKMHLVGYSQIVFLNSII